jgi:hypothetical protein
MTYSCVGWEVGYQGDMVRILRCGPVLGQDRISDNRETKVAVHEGVQLTPISSPMPSGARAIGRAQNGSPSCCVADVRLGNSSCEVTAA